MVPFVAVMTMSFIALFFLLSSIVSETVKKYNNKWIAKLESRNFGVFSNWDYFKNPFLRKKLHSFIKKAASEDAVLGAYINRFEDKQHFALYKMHYQNCRKEIIAKKAEKDVLQDELSAFPNSTEQKIYQEFYLAYKVKQLERGTAWSDSSEENEQSIIDVEVFKKNFVSNKKVKGE